jgi:hypothetical protein
MNMKTTRYSKPNLLVLLTFFVGVGVMASGVVLAAEALNIVSSDKRAVKHTGSGHRLPSLWNLDLAAKLRSWKPEFTVDKRGQGLNLVRPFGVRGPTLRLSNAMPDNVKRGLRAGGDHQIGAFGADNPDAYMFLEKRW